MSQKDRIDASISTLTTKRSQINSGLSIVSPNSVDTEISQLEIDKKIIVLRKERDNIDLKYNRSLNKLTEEEYNARLKQTEDSAVLETKDIDTKIELLKNKKQETPYSHIETKKTKLKSQKSKIKSDITRKRTQSTARLSKTLIKTGVETAIAGTLARLMHGQTAESAFKISKLDGMVDSVNTDIDAIKTADDIKKVTLSRNNAIKLLTDVEGKLVKLRKIIATIQKIVAILLLVVTIIKIALNFVPLPGPQALIQLKLDKAVIILTAILMIVTIATAILDILIALVQEIRDRLQQIGNLLDSLATSASDEDIAGLLNPDPTKLGLLPDIYEGFGFVLKEEFDEKFVVKGHKRRYAVAINKIGQEVLKSESSFTLDPEVLVEQLKVQIDSLNLTS